jgi:predicted GIY-YIG superfamily endonuclease
MNVAYLIRNKASSKVYVGSTSHPGGRISAHRSNLKRGVHENKNLQALYNESPHIDFVMYEVEDRETAYVLEKALIEHFNEKDELLNIALDPVDNKLTPELYEAFRKGNEIRTTEISIGVTIDNVEYPSLRDAARQFNISHTSIHKRVESAKKKYAGWYYTGKPKMSAGHNGGSNAVIVKVDGKEYTLSEYSRLTGISFKTLQHRKRIGIIDAQLHLPLRRSSVKSNGQEMLVVK